MIPHFSLLKQAFQKHIKCIPSKYTLHIYEKHVIFNKPNAGENYILLHGKSEEDIKGPLSGRYSCSFPGFITSRMKLLRLYHILERKGNLFQSIVKNLLQGIFLGILINGESNISYIYRISAIS